MKPIFLSMFLCLGACVSKGIIRDKQYEAASAAFRRGDVSAALNEFPPGEKNGFIPSVEKSWLNLWKQEWSPKALQSQVDTFDQRRYTSLTREAGYFLFQESEEGYVPAEHEIVLLHLLSAIHFNQQGLNEEAKVELRRAGYVLDTYWDDPALRLWLGSLWAGLGDWPEAQVDFRRAHALNPQPELKRLSESSHPQKITLHFFGNGPKTEWKQGQFTPEFLDEPKRTQLPIAASTRAWFDRHSKRNTELRDVLVKSNFMAQYLGNKTMTGAEYGITKVGTWSLRAIGVAVGVTLVGAALYVVSQSPTSSSGEAVGYLVAGGVGVGYGIWKKGAELDAEYSRVIRDDDRKKQESLRIYRMVRFMPTWMALELNESQPTDLEAKVSIKSVLSPIQLHLINHF